MREKCAVTFDEIAKMKRESVGKVTDIEALPALLDFIATLERHAAIIRATPLPDETTPGGGA